MGNSQTTNNQHNNFAPIQKSAQEVKFEEGSKRKEQEFVFVSKKEQDERKKIREERERQ